MTKQTQNKVGKVLTFFLFLVLLTTAVFANPTTEPCWVKGVVTSEEFDVAGLTVTAFSGSTSLKSTAVQEDGSFSLNSIGANTGDTIDLRVYGATFETFTFQGFCQSEDGYFITIDLDVAKVANGETCSNNLICTSGNCASNVCAPVTSSGTGGGSGGSSGGGSSGGGSVGGSGSTTSNQTTTTTSDTTGSPYQNTVSVSQVGSSSTIQIRASELHNVSFLPQDLIDLIEGAPETLITVEVTVKEATLANGEKRMYTEIRKLVAVTLDGSDVYSIIEIIPKDVVASADLLQGNFTVLRANPIIEFRIPKELIVNGFAQIRYTVMDDIRTKASAIETVVMYGDSQVQTPTTESTVELPSQPTQEQEPQKGRFNWLWILLIVLLIIGIVAMLLRK
jgi:hypothetical protein